MDSFIPTFFDLSDQERNAVIEAVKRGYYDYPRLGSQPRHGEPHRTPHIAHRVHCRALFYTAKIINFRGKIGMINDNKWHKIHGLSETADNGTILGV